VIVQPGLRVRPPGAPLQAVAEPQEAAELPTPPGNAAEWRRHGDPCLEAPGDRYSVTLSVDLYWKGLKVNFPAVKFSTENPEVRAV